MTPTREEILKVIEDVIESSIDTVNQDLIAEGILALIASKREAAAKSAEEVLRKHCPDVPLEILHDKGFQLSAETAIAAMLEFAGQGNRMSMSIKSLADGSLHEIRKMIREDDGRISVWSDTWYGHHVIGQDCEFAGQRNSATKTLEDAKRRYEEEHVYLSEDQIHAFEYAWYFAGQGKVELPEGVNDTERWIGWIEKRISASEIDKETIRFGIRQFAAQQNVSDQCGFVWPGNEEIDTVSCEKANKYYGIGTSESISCATGFKLCVEFLKTRFASQIAAQQNPERSSAPSDELTKAQINNLIEKIQDGWDKNGDASHWEGIKMAKRILGRMRDKIQGKTQ